MTIVTESIDTDPHAEIRAEVRKLCAAYPGAYWRELDREHTYPEKFVRELAANGWLAALIPEEYGGSGLPLSAAAAILEEIQLAGCNGGACHAQMYIMGALLRHGSVAQKSFYLPKIASGELRAPGIRRDGAEQRDRHHGAENHGAAGKARNTSSTARKFGHRERNTPT